MASTTVMQAGGRSASLVGCFQLVTGSNWFDLIFAGKSLRDNRVQIILVWLYAIWMIWPLSLSEHKKVGAQLYVSWRFWCVVGNHRNLL